MLYILGIYKILFLLVLFCGVQTAVLSPGEIWGIMWSAGNKPMSAMCQAITLPSVLLLQSFLFLFFFISVPNPGL